MIQVIGEAFHTIYRCWCRINLNGFSIITRWRHWYIIIYILCDIFVTSLLLLEDSHTLHCWNYDSSESLIEDPLTQCRGPKLVSQESGLWFYIENLKISTFYQITLVLSWSKQRLKHIYKSILDKMNSSYFKNCQYWLFSAS